MGEELALPPPTPAAEEPVIDLAHEHHEALDE